jgi:hypothetical protein
MRLMSICAGLLACVLSGCGPTGPKDIVWTEDVDLPDGRTIMVKRMERAFEHFSASGDTGLIERSDAALAFTGPLAKLPQWRYPLIALVLYQDANQQWVLVATTTDCDVWRAHGKPRPLYWEFRLNEHNNGWQEAPLSPASIGLQANLIMSPEVAGRAHVTVKDRRAAQAASSADRLYREVWGEPKGLYCGESLP